MQEESTTVAIAERVREALDGGDLSAITELLDPAVRWGAPDDMEGGCQNRKQVLDWYQRGREAGTRALVTEVVAKGDKILVGLKVRGTPAAEELGGEADSSIGRAGRGQGEIGEVRAAREMTVIKATCATAVECDGADAGMRVK